MASLEYIRGFNSFEVPLEGESWVEELSERSGLNERGFEDKCAQFSGQGDETWALWVCWI